MAEPIVIDDDEVQCLGGTPPHTTRAPFHSRNTSNSSAGFSPSSNGSTTSSSSKKRKTKQVNDGRLLSRTDWQFEDGIRSPSQHHSRSRESTMSLADAPSPRSTGSNGSANGSSPNSPTRQLATAARSYILIDSSTGTTGGTDKTSMTFGGSTGTTPSKTTAQSGAQMAPIPFSFDKAAKDDTLELPLHSGSQASHQSKSSHTSSSLSDPPQSRGVSFDTFQASLLSGSPALPPRIATLKIQDTPGKVIDLSGDDEDEDKDDDEFEFTGPTTNGWGREDTTVGTLRAFQNRGSRHGVEEVQATARVSKDPTPSKRKRSEAFSADDDEREDPEFVPSPSSRCLSSACSVHSARSARSTRSVMPNQNLEISARHSSRDSGSRDGSRRAIPDMECVTIEGEEVFVDLGDDIELAEDEDCVGDESDLPEIPGLVGIGRKSRCIHVDTEEDAYFEKDDEVEFMGSKPVKQVPRPSVVAASRRRSSVIPTRNAEIVYPLEDIGSVTHRGWELTKGAFFEVSDLDGTNTTFLLINHVIRNHVTHEIKIRGHRFERARRVFGMLDRKRNEMCRMLEVDEDDSRDPLVQGQIEVDLSACIYKPREINITNRRYGSRGTCTFRLIEKGWGLKTKLEIEERMLLACRWECIRYWPTAKNRIYQDLSGCRPKDLRMLKANDPQLVGHSVRQDDDLIRDEWRGKGSTVLGGSFIPGGDLLPQGYFKAKVGVVHKVHVDFKFVGRNEGLHPIASTSTMDLTVGDEVDSPNLSEHATGDRQLSAHLSHAFDLTDSTPIPPSGSVRSSISSSGFSAHARLSVGLNHIRGTAPTKRRPGQKYTYGDAFCGAGGATRGAHMAGLKVLWGFDLDTYACKSWHRNFPSAAIYEMDAHRICSHPTVNFRCDILHMSPPCQYFSPAHTISGKCDEANSAALFAVDQILKTARPRLATLEQTFGITMDKFTLYFQRLVNMFTTLEYSVTYKVCQLANWGLPQRRTRLIIFAAGPGETLPQIPSYTHCEDGNIDAALAPWAGVAPLIDIIPLNAPNHDLPSATVFKVPKDTWKGNSICPKAMTTAGGQNYHYEGRRMLTNREFATIQGFPMEHKFGSRNVKRQIGNAVPPVIAKLLFETCRRSLEEADGVEKEVISLDDE